MGPRRSQALKESTKGCNGTKDGPGSKGSQVRKDGAKGSQLARHSKAQQDGSKGSQVRKSSNYKPGSSLVDVCQALADRSKRNNTVIKVQTTHPSRRACT